VAFPHIVPHHTFNEKEKKKLKFKPAENFWNLVYTKELQGVDKIPANR
jgi:hypothetical protein